MTPPSIDRIRKDDQFLDALGGRGGPADGSDLSGLLQSWVDEIDSTPAASSAGAKRMRRRLLQTGAAAGLAFATLSVSSMAAAVTGTQVPVLYQLGSMAGGIFGGTTQQPAQSLLGSGSSTSSDGSNEAGSTDSSSEDGSSSTYGPPVPSSSATALPQLPDPSGNWPGTGQRPPSEATSSDGTSTSSSSDGSSTSGTPTGTPTSTSTRTGPAPVPTTTPTTSPRRKPPPTHPGDPTSTLPSSTSSGWWPFPWPTLTLPLNLPTSSSTSSLSTSSTAN
ncbi:hypothetical protein [Luteipulveratus mongoliensis]|uniref:Uncharacterized protein n=1 Tax=Luteipulveratus mongoliensis TaxID=571913 RepID=A0A0K1JHG8_9MICO|nr:hypothetical protein [Luteipulveratus mongoliensis]AKU16035.1 hypothetical protein VV02_09480 [Luteipulveratus mongoliensis]